MTVRILSLTLALALTWALFDLTSSLPSSDGNSQVNGPTGTSDDQDQVVDPKEKPKEDLKPTDPPLTPPPKVKRAAPEGYRIQERLLSSKDSPLQIQHIEFKKLGGNRRKRAVFTTTEHTWPRRIPYKIKDGMPSDVERRLRDVLQYVEDNLCVEFIEEPNFDPENNTYGLKSYILFLFKSQSCYAYLGRGADKPLVREVSTCVYWNTMIHEVFHSLGTIHENQAPGAPSFIYLGAGNIHSSHMVNFRPFSGNTLVSDFFDPSSVMMYTQMSFSRTGLPSIEPMRRDIYSLGSNNIRATLYELNEVYKCRELECNNATVDCGLGYYTKAQGECKCVCPERFTSRTNCASLYGESDDIPAWPNAPLIMWSVGPDSCPPEMDEGTISIPAYVFEFADPDMKVGRYLTIRVCSLPSTADSLSAMPQGEYCVVKPTDIPCDPFIEASYSLYSTGTVTTQGNVGDVTVVDGRNITMRFCCRKDATGYPMVLRNAHSFRILPFQSTKCQPIEGMISRWGKTALYTRSAYPGDTTPKLLKYSTSFYFYHCMYYAPSLDCNMQVELDADNRMAHVSTPGFSEGARTPNKRCLYYFKLPEGSRAVVTFNKFDITSNDHFLVKRYNAWVKGQPLSNDNYPKHLLTTESFLLMEFWSYADIVTNEGVDFTVKIMALQEEMCYDPQRKGSDYSGNKWMTVYREPCVPWTEALTCDDFPYHGLTVLDLKVLGNKCRNPGGELSEPWCYTSVEGSTCQKAYCDVCNLLPNQDILDNCHQMYDADPTFCTTNFLRLECAEFCGIPAFPKAPDSTACPSGWNEHKDRCWKWFPGARSISAADNHCYSLGGTIFRLRNQDDTNMIMNFQASTSDDEAKLSVWANGKYMPHSAQFKTLGDHQTLPFEDLATTAEKHNPSQGNLFIRAYDQAEPGKLDTASDSDSYNVICEIPRVQVFGPPTPPEYSVPSEPLASSYVRGDRMTFTCTRSGFKPHQLTVECGIDGWPPVEVVCEPCLNGWTLYKDRCWTWNYLGRTQQKSLEYCQGFDGATMFKIRDENDLAEIRNFKQTSSSSAARWNTWINARSTGADGKYYTLDDNTLVTYTPWKPNAVTTDATKPAVFLIGEGKTNAGTYQPISPYKRYRVFCEMPSGRGGECGGLVLSEQKCLEIVSFIPDLCSNPERAELAKLCSALCTKCPEEKDGLDQCPSDWLVKGNRCYKWFSSGKTQTAAETYCNNLDGTIFKVKDADDLQAMRSFLQTSTAYGSKWNVWLNARRYPDGVWRTLDDQSPVEYFNWVSGLNSATHQHINAYLNGESKTTKGFYSIASNTSTFRFFCQQTLDNVAQCTVPAPGNGAHPTSTALVGLGDVLRFECDDGFFRDTGTTHRTCLSNMNLAGQDLVCSEAPRTFRLNEQLIVARPKSLDLNAAFVFAVPEFTIPHDGEISEWYYFAQTPGDVNFIVFRQIGESSGNYTKVGSNSFSVTKVNYKMSVAVPESDRIQVQAGDFLGVFSTTVKIATHVCSSSAIKLMNMGRLSSVTLADLDSPQTFDTKCVIPSVGATLQTFAPE